MVTMATMMILWLLWAPLQPWEYFVDMVPWKPWWYFGLYGINRDSFVAIVSMATMTIFCFSQFLSILLNIFSHLFPPILAFNFFLLIQIRKLSKKLFKKAFKRVIISFLFFKQFKLPFSIIFKYSFLCDVSSRMNSSGTENVGNFEHQFTFGAVSWIEINSLIFLAGFFVRKFVYLLKLLLQNWLT